MKRKKGYYWVRMRYKVTIDEWAEDWEICHYTPEEDEWVAFGDECALSPDVILEIDERRLEHASHV